MFYFYTEGDKPFKIDCEQEDNDEPNTNCLSAIVLTEAAMVTTDATILTTDVTDGYKTSQSKY